VSYLLAVPVDANTDDVVVFEADRPEVPDGLVLASPEPGRVADRARKTLEEALADVRPSLDKIVALLRQMSPNSTEVEFGLKIGGETGMIIAKGTAEVNFTVRMSWTDGTSG
jgi:Trypsin-co-occurring domain 1